jgi:hypothetical protein
VLRWQTFLGELVSCQRLIMGRQRDLALTPAALVMQRDSPSLCILMYFLYLPVATILDHQDYPVQAIKGIPDGGRTKTH